MPGHLERSKIMKEKRSFEPGHGIDSHD